MSKIFSLLPLVLGFSLSAHAGPFKNLESLRQNLGFTRLEANAGKRTVRVAVLDKGFSGYQRQIGKSLPTKTVYIPGPLQAPADLKTEHGLRMAQIMTGLYSKDTGRSQGLELYLYNVFGFTNFQAAVQDLINRKIDVVLYSEVWEFGGNLDGRGFINAEISKATSRGILWVNAVGNFAQTTYNGPIQTLSESRVYLPDESFLLRIECHVAKGKTCPVRAVLSWNDFKDNSSEGTDKDLDFELVNSLFDRIAVSELRQTKKRLGDDAAPGASNYPRETIVSEVKSGFSYLKVKNYSNNFGDRDRLRITIDGENLSIPSGDRAENILVPADHPEVIAVGASDSDRSGVSLRLQRPDVLAPSSIILNDGNEFRGSSNSAAITAAAAALLRRQDAGLTREEFLSQLRPYSWSQGGLSLQWLRFGAVDGTCFQEGQWDAAPAYVRRILDLGGKLVQTNQGWRIMLPYDPVQLSPELARSRADDLIAATPEGLGVYSRFGGTPAKAIEVFQRPLETGLCIQPVLQKGRQLAF
ncbi:MAG: S8/S53 family peptidase [Bdellovibrionaceae bacterium]|nr:S8/S53 family peptidase [Pseudobdellovibrionaceae bacterium]